MVILSLALYVFNMKHEIKMIQYNLNILIIALYKTIDIANDTFEEDSWVCPQRPGGGGGCLREAINTKYFVTKFWSSLSFPHPGAEMQKAIELSTDTKFIPRQLAPINTSFS